MDIYIEVIAGPGLGTRYQATSGATLGGGGCDFVMKDPSIRGNVGRFEKDPKGRLQIVDISKKKSILVNQMVVEKVVLIPGITFKIGGSTFKVAEGSASAGVNTGRPWAEILYENLHSHIFSNFRNEHFDAFVPALQLNVVSGALVGSEYVVGFGPREFGYNCFDFDLNDPLLEDRAFALIPGQRPVIKSLCGDKVLLNDSVFTESAVSNNDEIKVGSLKIKVIFLERF